MIVLDTSAVFAVVNREAESEAVQRCLKVSDGVLMSAGTLVECMIAAHARRIAPFVRDVLDAAVVSIISVDEAFALEAVLAHRTWGRGNHRASLNFGDCFAYALAKQRDLPLLYVGQDFARTDVRSALAPQP